MASPPRMPAVSVALVLALATVRAGGQPGDLERAFADFWKADDAKGAERVVERLIRTGVDFDKAYAWLQAGRTYGKEKTGQLSMRFTVVAGLLLETVVEVPPEYSPERRWQLRVQLHGGVHRQTQPVAGGLVDEDSSQAGRAPNAPKRRPPNRIPGSPQIYVLPSASADAAWWHAHQVENIVKVVDRVKRRYNVDESQIYLTGISDGGTGTYYVAMKDPTIWSAFLPLNGSIKVLGNPAIRADGELYPGNLVNRPLYIVNGGRDPLYPAEHIATHVEAFTRLGVPLLFRPQANGGHDTSWWPYERSLFEQFVKQKPRVAHPERLSWETERTDRFNRVDWLIIDRLGDGSADTRFEDVPVFEHRRASGRVDVLRKGNRFDARSRGVKEFTLLLSPDVIDFAQPVLVTVNGSQVYQGTVKKDAAVLLKWAARDGDRTRLYAAELRIQVP